MENVNDFLNKKFPTYILSLKSLHIFKRFDINPEFLELDPTE